MIENLSNWEKRINGDTYYISVRDNPNKLIALMHAFDDISSAYASIIASAPHMLSLLKQLSDDPNNSIARHSATLLVNCLTAELNNSLNPKEQQ